MILAFPATETYNFPQNLTDLSKANARKWAFGRMKIPCFRRGDHLFQQIAQILLKI